MKRLSTGNTYNKERSLKKILFLACLFLCLSVLAAEDAPQPIPQEVSSLLSQAHPDLQVLAKDSWSPTWAVVLGDKQGAKTLCIVDKPMGQATYRLAVDNPAALRQTGEVPRLHMDTDEVLFYGYPAVDKFQAYLNIAASRDEQGVWRMGNISTYTPDGTREWSVLLQEGLLYGMFYETDANDNILMSFQYTPLPVPHLAGEDRFNTFVLRDEYSIASYVSPHTAAVLLPEGSVFLEGYATTNGAFLVTLEHNQKRLYLYQKEKDGQFTLHDCGPFPLHVGVELELMEIRLVLTGFDGIHSRHRFVPFADGRWALNTVMAGKTGEEHFGFGLHMLQDYQNESRHWFSRNPWQDIRSMDLNSLPMTIQAAKQGIDQTSCAVVNNPNPKDRLHLRTRPDRNADSLGKYYNGSFVLVLEEKGGWVKADIGGIQGWMMRQYLAFGSDMDKVTKAIPQENSLLGEYLESGIPLYKTPEERSDTAFWLKDLEMWHDSSAIGQVGEDWLHIVLEDGRSGYVKTAWLWAGNG